ncbi:protein of unknown function (DUF4592) [Popillia japonica]|uniref:DUF4592 domain-containing protein n=1 Tax=Popillia japonica TaxID=7064 RepID=A0AAW1KFV2_POPJA
MRHETELTERLRLRRGRGDTSEDDEGLPRSPCNSPTVTDKTAIKDNPKSHSTCSEGSLLSVGSSEMDEDSLGQPSIHSSKLSLEDRNTGDNDFDLDLSVKNTSAPLNHSGARHKASVKPQRRYGAPRKKRLSGSVLPTTPEVNEDTAARSMTPEGSSTKEIVTELYTSTTTTTNFSSSSSKNINKSNFSTLTEKQLKCSSLPPGLAAPGSDTNKLNRSRSNAGTKYQEEFGALGEQNESKNNKKTDSFLGRIFPRRSGKKRKSKEEVIVNTSSTTLSTTSNLTTTSMSISKQSEIIESSAKEFIHSERKSESLAIKPIPVPRSGAAARQRIQPNDIPASPDLGTRLDDGIFKSSPERTHTVSPLQMELESHFQQRLASLSTSPKSPQLATPPTSPRLQRSPLISPTKSPLPYPKVPLKSHVIEKMNSKHSRSEESRSKVIISGLSPFQQRVSATNFGEDSSDGFKSLNDLPAEAVKSSKLVAKSHSFKINNNSSDCEKTAVENRTTFAALATTRSTQEIQTTSKSVLHESQQFTYEIKKSSSLDNIENLEAMHTDKAKETFETIAATKLNAEKSESVDVNTVSRLKLNELEDSCKSLLKQEATETESVWTSESNKTENAKIESVNFEPKIVQSEIKEFIDKSYSDTTDFINSGITISGPRHKAIVSVSNESSIQSSETSCKTQITEVKREAYQEVKEQISVTKIQVKQESTHITNSTNTSVPEFMHIHLHKVDKPLNNVVLTAGFQSPKADEQNKTVLTDLPDVVTCNNPANSTLIMPENEKSENCELQSNETVRKFSKEDIEIIDKNETEDDKKHVATALVTITTMTPPIPTRMYKKNDFQIRKSLITVNNSEKPILKTKSSSLDIVESMKYSDENKIEGKSDIKTKTQSVNDLSSDLSKSDIKTKTQSVNDLSSDLSNAEPAVPLRRKSMANNKQKTEDEPELMKVFARRSLKLKDNESECLSQQVIRMMEDSNGGDIKSRDSDKENQLDSPSEERKKIIQKDLSKTKEPLLETKFVETPEVTLRKTANVPNNNKLYSYQRTTSLNNSKTNDLNNYDRMQKQNSCADRPKTDHWITYKVDENDSCTKLCQDEILAKEGGMGKKSARGFQKNSPIMYIKRLGKKYEKTFIRQYFPT